MDAFTIFATSDYTFLQLDGKTGGNAVVAEFPANGVVKLRDGMEQSDNVEVFTSSSTVHIRPGESFVETLGANLVGHGMRIAKGDYNSENYRIIDQKEGFDFETGQLSFYLVALKRESIWQQDESDLPLT